MAARPRWEWAASLLLVVLSAVHVHANDALLVNPNTQNNKTAQIVLTTWGSDWYFAVMSIMGATGLTILALSLRKPRSDRVFFYLSGGLCMVACIAYFSMGSNLGWTPIDVEWRRGYSGLGGVNRQIFYVRYIDWFVTTPMLLLDLCLTAALPWTYILWIIGLDIAMVVMGLVGALVRTRYKWGFYVFGLAAMIGIFYELMGNGRRSAARIGNDVHRAYLTLGSLLLFIWTLYPIAWGLCEGGNVISPSSEGLFYGILDLIAKPVFSIALIAAHWRINPARLGVNIREFTLEPTEEEKRRRGEADGISGDGVAPHHHNNQTLHAHDNASGAPGGVAAGTIDPARPHMA